MRTKLISAVVALGMLFGLSSCIVHTRPRGTCGYGTHWNGYRCARNSQVRVRYKPNKPYKAPRTVIIKSRR